MRTRQAVLVGILVGMSVLLTVEHLVDARRYANQEIRLRTVEGYMDTIDLILRFPKAPEPAPKPAPLPGQAI